MRLMKAVLPSVPASDATRLSESITRFLDQPIYANGLVNISELRVVYGMKPEYYQALAPYITAIPGNTQGMINVKTAPVPVWMSISDQITQAKAQALVSCIKNNVVFTKLDDFNRSCAKAAGLPAMTSMSVDSKYYIILGQARTGNVQTTLRSFIVTQVLKNNKIETRLVWQSLS